MPDPIYPCPVHAPAATAQRCACAASAESAASSPDARGCERWLVAIPIYNEERSIPRVLDAVLSHAKNVLVIDDGSTDATPDLLTRFPVRVIRHARNAGYGRSLRDAFDHARRSGFDWVITMDCDEQHEPESIPVFVQAAATGRWDLISGSRYLVPGAPTTEPPADRRAINQAVTRELNERLGLSLTDAFCGFKAHRVAALNDLRLDVDGYAFPMQLWVQAVAHGWRIGEVPVSLIYNDPNRTFGGHLDDPALRLLHYRQVLHRDIRRHADRLPPAASVGLVPCQEAEESHSSLGVPSPRRTGTG
jgi:dolichol-phosphate mannosyltransferase